jgi:hypothetical protein
MVIIVSKSPIKKYDVLFLFSLTFSWINYLRFVLFVQTETGAELGILLMDSSQQPGIVELHPSKEKPITELVPHIQTESETIDIRKHRVFLLR